MGVNSTWSRPGQAPETFTFHWLAGFFGRCEAGCGPRPMTDLLLANQHHVGPYNPPFCGDAGYTASIISLFNFLTTRLQFVPTKYEIMSSNNGRIASTTYELWAHGFPQICPLLLCMTSREKLVCKQHMDSFAMVSEVCLQLL